MSDRLAEIEARVEATTPGQWHRTWCLSQGHYTLCRIVDNNRVPLRKDEDWTFVELARADVPWLTAQVRERDAEIARVSAERDQLADAWALAEQMVAMFDELAAPNYVEQTVAVVNKGTGETRRFAMSIVRVPGLTPHEHRELVERERDALTKQVEGQTAEIARLRAALAKSNETMDSVLDCPGAAIRAECAGCSAALECGSGEVEALLAPAAESPDA